MNRMLTHGTYIMKKRVLIIEDDKLINLFIENKLKREHFEVDIAHDGEVALEKINRIPYDLIITDMMLPHISGLELVSYIKSSKPNNFAPIIILSAMTSPEFIVQAFEVGISDYITKPFSLKVIIARISYILERYSVHKD